MREMGVWVVLDSSLALPTLQLCGLGQIASPRELSLPSRKSWRHSRDCSTPMGPLRCTGPRGGPADVWEAGLLQGPAGAAAAGAMQREVAQPLSGLSARRAGVLGLGLISSG